MELILMMNILRNQVLMTLTIQQLQLMVEKQLQDCAMKQS